MQEMEQASVVYTLTMDDLVAANLFQFRHSSTIQKMVWRSCIVSSLTAFACGFGVPLLALHMPLWPSLCIAIACTVWTIGYFLYYQKRGYIKRVRKMVERMASESKYPGLLGEHTLEVDAEGITHVSAYSRTRYAWGALERVEAEPGYTYIFLGSQTFVIRHEAVVAGDFKAFLEKIARHHQPDKTIAR